MTETPVSYRVTQPDPTRAMIDTELYALQAELVELERRLIPLLVTVQRALGKEPSVQTPAERRRATVERRRG